MSKILRAVLGGGQSTPWGQNSLEPEVGALPSPVPTDPMIDGPLPRSGYDPASPYPSAQFSDAFGADPSQFDQQRIQSAATEAEMAANQGQVPQQQKSGGGFGKILNGIADAVTFLHGGLGRRLQDKENEKIANAMGMMQTNPQQGIIEMAKVNPKFAADYLQNKDSTEYRNAMLGVRQQTAATQGLARKTAAEGKYITQIGGMVGTIKDQATYEKFYKMQEGRLAQFGLSPDAIGMPSPSEFTPEVGQTFARSTMTAYQQATDDIANGRLDETQNWHNRIFPIMQQDSASKAVAAGAQASRAGTAAAVAPSQIGRNEAGAAKDASQAGVNNARVAGTLPGSKGVRTTAVSPPGRAPAGAKVRGSDGTKWLGRSDGTWQNMGK